MLMRNKWLAPLLAASIVLSGCSSLGEAQKRTESRVKEAEAAIKKQQDMRDTGAVVRMTSPKLAGQEVLLNSKAKLPSWFDESFNYFAAYQSLSDVLGEIGRRKGIPTAIQTSASAGGAMGMPATMGGMPGGMPGQQGPAMPQMPAVGDEVNAKTRISIEWKGSLRGLLDHLANRTGMFWKFEDGRIYFFSTETRVFHVHLPAGKRKVSSSIALAGTGSASTGSVDVSSDMSIDAYDAIVQSIQAMVKDGEKAAGGSSGGGGGAAGGGSGSSGSVSVSSNASLGLITVTSTPPVLDRVAEYMRGLNERFAQNVMIGVKVYNLTLRKEANAGVNAALAYQNLAEKYGVAVSGVAALATSGAAPGMLTVTASSASRMDGSNVVLQILEQMGEVSVVTSGGVIAANGQPSPLQMAEEVTYLASSTTATVPNVGTTTTLTPATRTIGFTANFLPLILGDNRIMLQYQINVSSLLSMTEIQSGTSKIVTPRVGTQSLQQQAYVRDGQSIVLFGFEQERSAFDKSDGMTGVSRSGSKDHSMMVIVMEVFSGK